MGKVGDLDVCIDEERGSLEPSPPFLSVRAKIILATSSWIALIVLVGVWNVAPTDDLQTVVQEARSTSEEAGQEVTRQQPDQSSTQEGEQEVTDSTIDESPSESVTGELTDDAAVGVTEVGCVIEIGGGFIVLGADRTWNRTTKDKDLHTLKIPDTCDPSLYNATYMGNHNGIDVYQVKTPSGEFVIQLLLK